MDDDAVLPGNRRNGLDSRPISAPPSLLVQGGEHVIEAGARHRKHGAAPGNRGSRPAIAHRHPYRTGHFRRRRQPQDELRYLRRRGQHRMVHGSVRNSRADQRFGNRGRTYRWAVRPGAARSDRSKAPSRTQMFFLNGLKKEYSRNGDGHSPNDHFLAEYNRIGGSRLAPD